ncbi:glutathione S-transferase family protein [Tropicimonas sediminicola]|uniref:Glutathione S-transferase n=1 Tax=Tropicimonas sediminicola TaxID=1031541 RepID=A0A239M7W4_9RHOB|nr:glutathione S-transferase family protein [Tropicimonas sediminicola]SNT38845.1 glutathione S-transferase [Tropicimonas sediminicola]
MAADYTLYYWPIPFRGHFIRYVLAHAGASWEEAPTEALMALKEAPASEQPTPFMAPPFLHDHGAGLWLSQLPAILAYLGQKHGLLPEAPELRALTLKVLGDANDVLEEVSCNCGREMWTQEAWDDFAESRLPRWMEIFEETGRRHGLTVGGGSLLGTDAPTLADLATAALWVTMTERLPALAPLLDTHAPAVAALSRRVADTPRIAEMRRDFDRRFGGSSYCGGHIEASLRDVLAAD